MGQPWSKAQHAKFRKTLRYLEAQALTDRLEEQSKRLKTLSDMVNKLEDERVNRLVGVPAPYPPGGNRNR
jgi:hypothetical protein